MTKNFKIKEFIVSATADKYHIDNMPRKYDIIDNIWTLCSEVLQPLRDANLNSIIVFCPLVCENRWAFYLLKNVDSHFCHLSFGVNFFCTKL